MAVVYVYCTHGIVLFILLKVCKQYVPGGEYELASGIPAPCRWSGKESFCFAPTTTTTTSTVTGSVTTSTSTTIATTTSTTTTTIQCGPGQRFEDSLHLGQSCLPCPADTYQALQNHRQTQCIAQSTCSQAQKISPDSKTNARGCSPCMDWTYQPLGLHRKTECLIADVSTCNDAGNFNPSSGKCDCFQLDHGPACDGVQAAPAVDTAAGSNMVSETSAAAAATAAAAGNVTADNTIPVEVAADAEGMPVHDIIASVLGLGAAFISFCVVIYKFRHGGIGSIKSFFGCDDDEKDSKTSSPPPSAGSNNNDNNNNKQHGSGQAREHSSGGVTKSGDIGFGSSTTHESTL